MKKTFLPLTFRPYSALLSKGRSMIEILAVLAIIGILSVLALYGFQYAMNRHRANETIHDVMLRATNVPMEYEDYHEWTEEFVFPSLRENGTLSTMGYPMATVPDGMLGHDFGYVYRVDVADVPVKVCRLILQLEPTDIDEIRVGRGTRLYTRGQSSLCDVDQADFVPMFFMFERLCESGADCNSCQRCEKGKCRADYQQASCGSDTEPPDPPEPPDPEEGCNAGIGCQNPCDECVSDPEDSRYGQCISKVCANPCQVCDSATGGCIDDASCQKTCPEGSYVSSTNGCGCVSCATCPTFSGCSDCETEALDEHGCQICQVKCTEPCQTCENGQCVPDSSNPACVCDPACGDCFTCVNQQCVPNEGDENCTCEAMGGTLVTVPGGACCNQGVDCCAFKEGDCPQECEPTDSDCPVGCGSAQILNAGKTCLDGSEGYWSVVIEGKPSGEADGCCLNCSGESIPHAYWDGSKGVCCFGQPYEDRNGNWGCCNTSEDKWVTKIYGADSGEMCCPTGQKAYTWAEGSGALCCNGEIARKEDGYYSCCSDGYHAFTIVGYPNGEDVGMCCHPDYTAAYYHESYAGQCCTGTPMTVETKRHDKEVYFCCKEGQKAYYDGAFACCQGEIYDYDAQNYKCCQYDEDKKNLLSTIRFADFGSSSPISDKWCCPEGQTAYWTGSEGYGYSAQCCAGEPYMGIDAPECCPTSYPSYDYDTGSEITIEQEVVSVTGIGGVSTCCASQENGVPLGGAYFAHSYSWSWGPRCCYGHIEATHPLSNSPADKDIYPTRTDTVYTCCGPDEYIATAMCQNGTSARSICVPNGKTLKISDGDCYYWVE